MSAGSAQVSVSLSVPGSCARQIPMRLFLARFREPVAGHREIRENPGQARYFLFSVAIVQDSWLHAALPLASPAALQKPVRLSLEVWAGEPQRGDLTKPRPTAWVSKTTINARALKGRNSPLQSHTYRSS